MKTFLLSLLICWPMYLSAQRIPVLPQIDLPHPYYYRELYLPQLTSGPSYVAWIDPQTVVYSMAGSLWKQTLGSNEATQLTTSDGYDYQPDVSVDGRIVFVRYTGTSTELMLLQLSTMQTTALTSDSFVNLEPRWSPDGKQIAFVSTRGTGHFLIHTAVVADGKLNDIRLITPDRKSNTSRYYYSAFDHAIHPVWTRTGDELLFVSNPEIVHGTGDLFAINIQTRTTRLIWHEETSWQARPDISPDGSRFVYSSFHGRAWHQLWLQPVAGGYPFPITYGEFDNRHPRWSPDGRHIAAITNRNGNTSLLILDALEGRQTLLQPNTRKYIQPHRTINVEIRDVTGKSLPSRVSIVDKEGRFYAPADAWVQADDSRMRDARFENHYFHTTGSFTVDVPQTSITITAQHGPTHEIAVMAINAEVERPGSYQIQINRLPIPGNWWSGDLHVHMNYGGHYRNQPAILARQAESEDLQFVYNLIVNKEQRITDVSYFSPSPDPASTPAAMVLHGQEYHTSFWGHLGLLHLNDHLLLPDYAAYQATAVASIYPHNSFIADRAHEQGALVGYVHPYDSSDFFPALRSNIMHAFPLDAALGKVDYFEVVGFSNHMASQWAWYQVLNAGLSVPAGAGTDAMANYASLRGPVGLNRVYVPATGALNQSEFEKAVREGRSFVSNGPLVGLTVNGASAGATITGSKGEWKANYQVWMRSNVPVEHVELIWNGQVVASHSPTGDRRQVDASGTVKLKGPGWLLVRAWSKKPVAELLDLFPYATTNPIHCTAEGKRYVSKASAAFLADWMSKLEAGAASNTSYRTPAEKEAVLNDIRKAKQIYVSLSKSGI